MLYPCKSLNTNKTKQNKNAKNILLDIDIHVK